MMGDQTVKGAAPQTHDGSNLRICIVHSRWNRAVIDSLTSGVLRALTKCNVPKNNIVIQNVPGSWELPSAVSEVVSGSLFQFDAVIAIGVLIKGETMHFEHIADAVSHGLMRAQLDRHVPVTFGVLTVLDEGQAKARAGMLPGAHNYGEDWGYAAVEMGVKRKEWRSGNVGKEFA